MTGSGSDHERASETPRRRALGPALRQAWVTYQRLVDAEMARAGFEDRRLPDGRVMRLCQVTDDLTAASIGRELGISRQAAGKLTMDLARRGYLAIGTSPADGRQKILCLTPRGIAYLDAQQAAFAGVRDHIRVQIGDEAYENLLNALEMLEALGGEGQPGLRDYVLQRR